MAAIQKDGDSLTPDGGAETILFTRLGLNSLGVVFTAYRSTYRVRHEKVPQDCMCLCTGVRTIAASIVGCLFLAYWYSGSAEQWQN